MSAGPLVSILINNYNYGRFLRDAVDSALNQSYGNTEIIVVDDGSTDNSRELIAGYGDKIIPVLKKNGGQGSAFNAGFAVCKGEMVCFLDSDDVWLPNKVETVVRAAHAAPDAVMIYHAYQRTDANLRPAGRTLPISFLEGHVGDKVLRCGGYWPYPPPSAFAFPGSVLQSYMPIPEPPFRTCADACLAYCTPLLGRIVAIKQPLCLYRMHDSNFYVTQKQDRVEAHVVRAERYRLNVDGANEVLARLGRTERFGLRDHIGYIKTRYLLDSRDRHSWTSMSWQLARMASEPSKLVRFKSLAKFWLASLGVQRP